MHFTFDRNRLDLKHSFEILSASHVRLLVKVTGRFKAQFIFSFVSRRVNPASALQLLVSLDTPCV